MYGTAEFKVDLALTARIFHAAYERAAIVGVAWANVSAKFDVKIYPAYHNLANRASELVDAYKADGDAKLSTVSALTQYTVPTKWLVSYDVGSIPTDMTNLARVLHRAYVFGKYCLLRWWGGINSEMTAKDFPTENNFMNRVAELVQDYEKDNNAKLNTIVVLSDFRLPTSDDDALGI